MDLWIISDKQWKWINTDKKLILNPGILALLIGMVLFITPLELPRPIFSAIKHAANLNTPLGMMVIGSRLSRASLRNLFEKGNAWICAVDRLLVVPLIAILLLYIFNIRGIPAIVCIIAGCAPAASATTMFAVLFHNNESLAANVVSSQTLLSALTMPLVVGLAKFLLS
jgi:Predicted permeases